MRTTRFHDIMPVTLVVRTPATVWTPGPEAMATTLAGRSTLRRAKGVTLAYDGADTGPAVLSIPGFCSGLDPAAPPDLLQ